MSNNSYDPCGHIKIAVSDYKKSYLFYKSIFEVLGYKQVSDKSDHAGWVSQEGYGVLIAQAENVNYRYKFNSPGLHHLCLKSSSVEIVDIVYQLLLKKGAFVFGVPKKYPDYTDRYYAVYLADPDGVKLEVAYY